MNILFVGDIVGRGGRKVFSKCLPQLKLDYDLDLIIANGENAANGFGITETVYKELIKSGAHVLTSGNHIWDQKGTAEQIDRFQRMIRPANYPPETPGRFFYETEVCGKAVVVFNLLGRVFMPSMDCPFRAFDLFYKNHRDKFIIVDFHGEATSEKAAFANYVDGRANVVIGTHTHVQTNDDRILGMGTLFLTDAGMCGAIDSIIGMEKAGSFKRFTTGMPSKLEVEKKGKMGFNALHFEVDSETGSIIRFNKIKLEYGEG